VSFTIAEHDTQLEAARWLCYRALGLRAQGRPHTREAAMCKWWAPRLAVQAINDCIVLHGHVGWSMEMPLQQTLLDVSGLQIGDGTPQIQKLVIARELKGRAASAEHPRHRHRDCDQRAKRAGGVGGGMAGGDWALGLVTPNPPRRSAMARYVTKVQTDRSAEDVFTYLADLRNFAEWDPGVRRVEQVEGDGGGPDTVFDVSVAGPGSRDLTLRYRTVEYDAPRELLVIATDRFLTSEDRITVDATPAGTVVTYDADLRLRGLLRIADPALRMVFGRIGDRAAAGLRRALDGQKVA
jgi:carbon monoxide dehydrogenase subunit G